MLISPHPKSGRKYIHVFPGDPFLGEIRDCYRSAASRIPYMGVDDFLNWTPDRREWFDEKNVIIFWGPLPEIPETRRAGVALRYTESVGPSDGLTPVQRDIIATFTARVRDIDVLIGGTETVAEFWRPICWRTAVAPIGYEPGVLGTPDWTVKKTVGITFHGNLLGRRTWILKALRRHFPKFAWINAFGMERKKALDRSLVDLYIGHSDEPSFPGMRIWQAISSSAALATEPRDAWPAVQGRHYFTLPPADHDKPIIFLDAVKRLLADPSMLRQVAMTAHGDLSSYTIEHCMEEFIIPATEGMHG
jgi:hypothetical protein